MAKIVADTTMLRFTNETVWELDGNCDDLATVRWQGFSSLRLYNHPSEDRLELENAKM
ncbi:hypothetical protein CCACVL1_30788 [Corchorus capsularis]|uniref:Uncharacterized protein n=1 Tax=Corchorus capsularis TaxID=210143 RepID=A0A1R3FVS5_COCAP|nr:hypothetical protein CCACVL1_30788 [Corchorus capsularis]